jgi:predicted membrane protein
MIERAWIIVAGVLLVVAAVFFWRNNVSAAFVTATLGAAAWFLSYRAQMRAKVTATDNESTEQQAAEQSDEN